MKDFDTTKSSHIGCIIMASGEGRRFGGNKMCADLNGKKLVEWAIGTASEVFEKTVVITRSEDVHRLCESKGINVVLHSMPFRSDTVRIGVEYFEDSADKMIFCQGDQPLITPQTLQKMVCAALDEPHKIIRLEYNSHPSSPVIFPKWAFNDLKNLPQDKGGNIIVKNNMDKVMYISAQNVYETMDVDTREDLEKIQQYLNNTQNKKSGD